MLNNVTGEFVYQNPSLRRTEQSLCYADQGEGIRRGIVHQKNHAPLNVLSRDCFVPRNDALRIIHDYFFSFSLTVALGGAVNPAILPSCMVSSAELGTITIVEFCFRPS